ncbi:MAG: formylglycine-generating enzyme family protein, partial [Gammaproteobacteria bacterium]|nr:formylglycine-generating enzyme family protein [Gammaproteobacteria bacterium]
SRIRPRTPLATAAYGLVWLLATGTPAAAQQSIVEIAWQPELYDPSPSAEAARMNELVLPMPCGGAMVFQRVITGGTGWLGERAIELGSRDRFAAPLDQLRVAHVTGAFGKWLLNNRELLGGHYFIGKYEVTELQLRVVGESCPDPLRGRRPAVKVSWYDAMDFTRRYTEWLHVNARDKLPTTDGVPGFLRLPTEAEWEYAARGGLEVDEVAFQQAIYPLGQHPLQAHAWFRESMALNFQTRPVGLLQPNPLGLHDVLGNAAELVFDLYQLSAGGRLRAQPGGFMVKGGHFRSPRSKLSTSMRQEHPHFNAGTGAQTRLDTVGFRVAISAPVLTSLRRLEVIQQDWLKRPRESDASAVGQCQDTASDTPPSAEQLLERCKIAMGHLSVPDFPQFMQSSPVSKLPPWPELRDQLRDLRAKEIHRYALAFLRARDPDTALLLFREAARKGDGESALAVGAMYDPLLFESDPGARTPFSKANRELARCWYQIAWTLGEVRAWARVKRLAAADDPTPTPAEPDLSLTPPGCEQLAAQYGSR